MSHQSTPHFACCKNVNLLLYLFSCCRHHKKLTGRKSGKSGNICGHWRLQDAKHTSIFCRTWTTHIVKVKNYVAVTYHFLLQFINMHHSFVVCAVVLSVRERVRKPTKTMNFPSCTLHLLQIIVQLDAIKFELSTQSLSWRCTLYFAGNGKPWLQTWRHDACRHRQTFEAVESQSHVGQLFGT